MNCRYYPLLLLVIPFLAFANQSEPSSEQTSEAKQIKDNCELAKERSNDLAIEYWCKRQPSSKRDRGNRRKDSPMR